MANVPSPIQNIMAQRGQPQIPGPAPGTAVMPRPQGAINSFNAQVGSVGGAPATMGAPPPAAPGPGITPTAQLLRSNFAAHPQPAPAAPSAPMRGSVQSAHAGLMDRMASRGGFGGVPTSSQSPNRPANNTALPAGRPGRRDFR